jgi:hypothetical protein
MSNQVKSNTSYCSPTALCFINAFFRTDLTAEEIGDVCRIFDTALSCDPVTVRVLKIKNLIIEHNRNI